MKKMFRSLLLFTILALSLSLAAQHKNDRKVLMQIGNEKVTVKEFMDVFSKNNVQNEMIDKKSLDEYLDLYANFRLKVLEAYALQLDTNQSFIKELAGYRSQLAKPYFTDASVTESLLLEAYNRKLYDVRASHILIMLDKNASPEDTLKAYNKIMSIRQRAVNGEDFGLLAAETSDDPSARDREAIPNQRSFRPGNKGDLGYFNVFDMVYPFESGAYNTEPGQISMPLRSEFGYHLIRVTDKTPASGLIEAAHIYVSVNPDADAEEIADKEQKINFIHNKIKDGMSFEEAVKEYSEDRGSASRDGLLSKFTVNRIVPEFVAAVKKMNPGEVSAPVRTVYGFHIIKLHGTEKTGSFEDEAPRLRERLSKDGRAQMSEEAVINRIKKDNKYLVFQRNLNAFLAKMDSSLTMGEFKSEAFAANKTPLFKLGKKNYTEADFALFLSQKQSPQEQLTPKQYAAKLFTEWVKESALAFEDEQLESKYPEFASLMKEYKDGILLFELMDQRVWTLAVKDTIGLRAYHEANRDNYLWNERASATIYTITNNDEVAKVKQLLQRITDEAELRAAFDADSIRSVRIQPGKFEKGDNKFVDQTAWKTGLSEVQTSEADRFSVIVRIDEVIPPQPKALEETRGIVTSDYQNFLEQEWLKELRKKYPVKVNTKVFNELKSTY